MTRIEENSKQSEVTKLEAEIDQLKKSLKRKQNKKMLSCGTCLLFFILIILIFCITGAYVLAKSGLKNIPFFTDRFYQEPLPIYLVKTERLSSAEKDIASLLEKNARAEFLKEQKTENLKINLKLSEEQITYLLRDQISKNESFNKIDYIQVAVLPASLELFVKFKDPKLFVILNTKPEIKNNNLKLAVESFKIGALKMPKFIGRLTAYLLEKSINKLVNSFSGNYQLMNIELASKFVTLEILLKNLKF